MDSPTGVAMKFWLACFFLLFVSAELLQWLVGLGGGQSSGLWLVMGGLGLAAASNAEHLPKLSSKNDVEAPAVEHAQQSAAQQATQTSPKPSSESEQPAKDSISFKVRLPWR